MPKGKPKTKWKQKNMNKKEMVCYNVDASRLVGKVEKVIFPKTSEEVQQAVKGSTLDIVPRGSGTNLVGGCVPQGSIVMDMRKMNEVSEFNSTKKIVNVGAGVTLKELNEKLARVGFEFPIECFNKGLSTIGGMVALNAPGFRSMKYGRMRDWIDQIEFVNGRGELMKLSKSDLMDVCGMEGITGIITSVVLRIIPKKHRTASIFQSDDLEEVFSLARRLKLEKEVVMLEFYPPEISKRLGLPEKYHLIIEFDSDRGKIKGEEYNVLSNFKYRIYDVLYSDDYSKVEDPKFFFDKLKEFILFLDSNQIPYVCYLDIGMVHPFFRDGDSKKAQEVYDFIRKSRARPGKFGIGISRKDLVDPFEKKVIQRVKLRHDPFLKFNKGKFIDIDSSQRRFPGEEKQHLRPVKREEFEEIKPLMGEEKGALEISDELKTPEEKMEEFIEKVELMDIIAGNEKPVKTDEELAVIRQKERQLEIDKEINERLRDYEQTFESELGGEKQKSVESFARNIGRDRPIQPVEAVVQRREPESEPVREPVREIPTLKRDEPAPDYRSIQDIMTNKVKKEGSTEIVAEKPAEKPVRVPAPDNDGVVDLTANREEKKEVDQSTINDIMNNRFGFSNGKKDEKKEEKDEEKSKKW